MQDYIKLEDVQNIAGCANESNGNSALTRKLYFERYGMDLSEADIKIAMELYGDGPAANCLKDADMSTYSINEAEENIIVKEEIEIGEESIVKTNDAGVKRIPMIYTTRLDEMQIFKKNFSTLTIDDIVSNVLLESKPNFEKPFQSDRERNFSFLKIVRKIEEFNKLCTLYGDDIPYISLSSSSDEDLSSDEDSSSDEDISEIESSDLERAIDLEDKSDAEDTSEEENIPLKQLSVIKDSVTAKAKNNINPINLCKPCSIPLKPSRKVVSINGKPCVLYDKPIYTKRHRWMHAMTFVKGIRYKIGKGCCVLFKDLKTQSSAFFVFDKNGLFSKTFPELVDSIFYVRTFWRNEKCFGLQVDICCWFFREYVISSLICPTSMNIWRYPHSCPPDSCNCCCKDKSLKFINKNIEVPLVQSDTPANKNGLIKTADLIVLDDDIKEVSIKKKSIIKDPIAEPDYHPDRLIAKNFKKTTTVPAITADFNKEFLEYAKKEKLTRAKKIKENKNKQFSGEISSKESHAKSATSDNNKTAEQISDPLTINNLNNNVSECTKKDQLICDNSTNTTTGLTDVNDLIGIQILKNYSGMTEFYELTATGNIVKHIEMMSKYLLTSENFRRAVKLSADSNKVFCCWRKRDAMIRTFEFRYTTIAQFIRSPHPCPPDNCICCCKPSGLKSSPKVNDLANPKYAPKHAYTYTGMTKQRRKFINKMSKAEHEKVTTDLSVDSTDKHVVSKKSYDPELLAFELLLAKNDIIINETIDPTRTEKTAQKSNLKNPVIPPKNNSKTRTIDQTDATFIYENKIQSIQVATPPQKLAHPVPSLQQPQPTLLLAGPSQLTQSNIALPANNIPPTSIPLQNNGLGPTVNPKVDPTVDSIVNSILHRFNDVRLIITPDGDVSAELNQPVQTLSTTELQLLSQILSHAKEQVKQLKAAGHLNSGANTILNPWPANSKSNTNITPAQAVNNTVPNVLNTTPSSTQSAPIAPNINATTKLRAIPTHALIKPSKASNSSKIITYKENVVEEKLRNDAFQCYTNLSALKQKEYMTSCRSYLNDLNFIPKIGSVFSLSQDANMVQNLQSQTKYQTPIPKKSGVKRKTFQNPRRNNSKKSKNMDNIETIDLDVPDSEITPQPSTSAIPRTVSVGTDAPILSNILTKPYVVPGVAPVVAPGVLLPVNQFVVVTDTLPSGTVFPIIPLASPSTIQPPNNDTVSEKVSDDDDCILGY